MIDVSELLCDPDLCTAFTIVRHGGGRWEKRRWTGETPERIEAVGIVTATAGKDLERLPEGDRAHGLKTFYTAQELRLTGQEATSDLCEYRGRCYRLLQVFDYSQNGYYKAIGTLIGGM